MSKGNSLKCIAAVSMVIDHMGLLFFPQYMIFRLIGRLAFPIFAYQCAVGAAYTSSIEKYLLRILAFALLSQPVYSAMVPGLNILFTIFYGVLLIALWKEKNSIGKGCSIFLLFFSWELPFLDYGFFGVLMIVCFYLFLEKKKLSLWVQCLVHFWYTAFIGIPIQAASMFALPLIYKKWDFELKFPRWFFYAFYPVHLLALLFIKRFF